MLNDVLVLLQAMTALAATQQANKEAAAARERELAAVKINKEDVDVIALVGGCAGPGCYCRCTHDELICNLDMGGLQAPHAWSCYV